MNFYDVYDGNGYRVMVVKAPTREEATKQAEEAGYPANTSRVELTYIDMGGGKMMSWETWMST